MYIIPAFTPHSYVCQERFSHYYIHVYNEADHDILEDWELPTEIKVGKDKLALISKLQDLCPKMELAQTDPNRCAVLCANLGGDTDTIGAMATAICGALHGVNAIDPALKAELDAVNQLDFNRYATALAKYRQQREAV